MQANNMVVVLVAARQMDWVRVKHQLGSVKQTSLAMWVRQVSRVKQMGWVRTSLGLVKLASPAMWVKQVCWVK